jgi:elongation factor Tu
MSDGAGEDFVLKIVDVFTLTGRGTVVVGPIESGVLRTGESVEIYDDERLVMTARADVELIRSRTADPRIVALRLGNVDKALLRSGQTVRRPAASVTPS